MTQILREIDAEIQRLQQARSILAGSTKPPVKRAAAAHGRRTRLLSAAARAKISAAQRAPWAKARKAAK
jgi:ElaB/YqjD/DUF883 family membrane-anchored ribosome-binding protein